MIYDKNRRLSELREMAELCATAPTLAGMPRRTLADKGINGPTGAHLIEEIHSPLNLAYITVTTGTTAFQNIVGVTHNELPQRMLASERALALAGVKRGDRLLFTYPPLVNVFCNEALKEYGVSWFFLNSSDRDALLVALCDEQPNIVVGESSFLRATLEDAKKLDLLDLIPKNIIFITAGTPLDLELVEVSKRLVNGVVHDLYGCQEFGWLALDGLSLRDDITLAKVGSTDLFDLIVGGLPTGDRFPVIDVGHICNNAGKIITYARERTQPEIEATITKTTANSVMTAERAARSILRIKGKIVRVSKEIEINANGNELLLSYFGENAGSIEVRGEKTLMFDSLLQAQIDFQSSDKKDKTWIKSR